MDRWHKLQEEMPCKSIGPVWCVKTLQFSFSNENANTHKLIRSSHFENGFQVKTRKCHLICCYVSIFIEIDSKIVFFPLFLKTCLICEEKFTRTVFVRTLSGTAIRNLRFLFSANICF